MYVYKLLKVPIHWTSARWLYGLFTVSSKMSNGWGRLLSYAQNGTFRFMVLISVLCVIITSCIALQ